MCEASSLVILRSVSVKASGLNTMKVLKVTWSSQHFHFTSCRSGQVMNLERLINASCPAVTP